MYTVCINIVLMCDMWDFSLFCFIRYKLVRAIKWVDEVSLRVEGGRVCVGVRGEEGEVMGEREREATEG